MVDAPGPIPNQRPSCEAVSQLSRLGIFHNQNLGHSRVHSSNQSSTDIGTLSSDCQVDMAVPNPSPVSSSSSGSGVPDDPGVGHAPGTSLDPFSPLIETEVNNPTQTNAYQNILVMECYKRWSGEELRLADYNKGHHYGSSTMTLAATALSSTRVFTGFNPFSPKASNPFAPEAVSPFGSSIWSNPGTSQAPEVSESTADTAGGLRSTASAGIFSAAATRGTNSSVRSDISEGSQKSKKSAGIFSSAATRGTNSSVRSDISEGSQKSKESETELEWLK